METSVLSRREWLRCCGAAGMSCLLGETMKAAEHSRPARAAVDHLLLGVSDLDHGIAWVEERTDVKASIGGSHPGAGTRNALISLGGRQYLEIIAPDPKQASYSFQIDVRTLVEPRLITWAAATLDIERTAKKAQQAGLEIFGPREGSRARPDGTVLHWRTLGIVNPFGGNGIEPVPFFIQWAADSRHPSQDSPKGCELQALAVEHPDPESVAATLKHLGVNCDVAHGNSIRLTATLSTPRGKVQLS